MTVRWTLYDPIAVETWTVPLNPREGGSPDYRKNILTNNTTAPDGLTLLHEGTDEPQTLEVSGVILTQDHLDTFVTWWRKRHQLLLTDDLGRTFWVYLTEFVPTRKRSYQHPWRHDYNAKFFILDIPT